MLKISVSTAISEAVIRWRPTAMARVQFQGIPCDTMWHWGRFYFRPSASLANNYHCTSTLYPSVGRGQRLKLWVTGVRSSIARLTPLLQQKIEHFALQRLFEQLVIVLESDFLTCSPNLFPCMKWLATDLSWATLVQYVFKSIYPKPAFITLSVDSRKQLSSWQCGYGRLSAG